MGLFDHLFKPKSPPGEETVGEPAAEGSPAARTSEGGQRTQRADPSAFLHPKNFVPRGAAGLTPAPRSASGVSGRNSEKRTGPGGAAPDEIVLTLGDVLSRIPTQYLKPGTHAAKRELRFKINDLSSDIARGRAAVPLSRIAQLVPEIFVKEIAGDEDTEVRLPLQKLVEQIGMLRSQPRTTVIEKIAHPAIPAALPMGAGPATEVDPTTLETVAMPLEALTSAAASKAEPLHPITGPPSAPPIVLAEPVTVPQAFELKPAAEQSAAAPVILGPSPVLEVPAAPAAPIVPPMPAAATSEPEPPIAPTQLTPEPAATIFSPPPIVPPVAEEPEKVVIASIFAAPEKTGERPESRVAEVATAPAHPVPAVEGTKLAPLESPEPESGEERIQLSLAAILRQCPAEIIVGQLPHVDDSVKISLPFAPIDRQLVKGQVEVTALRFIAALPEVYQKYFAAKIGVKVPIPLEEVFQNLPAPTHELKPVTPTPPPVVLAPAVHPAEAAPVSPPPLSIPAPEEPSQVETPAIAAELAPGPAAVAPKPEFVPLEAAATIPMPSVVEPPPIPSVAAFASPQIPQTAPSGFVPPTLSTEAAPEVATAVPPTEVTPPPLPTPHSDASAPPAGGESPTLTFHPPIFRPHFVPPPPIFGFAPAPVVPEPEPASKPEPPSVLPGLVEAAGVTPALTPESAAPEASQPAAPVSETPVAEAATVAPVAEVPAPAEPPPLPVAATPPAITTEAPPVAASDAEPSAELIALAGEHAAPDIVPFSGEPVPFADLAETLAHETTYAPDLAEVVHMDLPEAEPAEAKAEKTEAAAEEHRAVPIVEGLAVTAVAATIAAHAPLDFRQITAPAETPEPTAEPAPAPEMPVAEQSGTGEPLVPDQPSPAAETAPPLAERVTEPEPALAAPAPEIPAAPAKEPPAAAVPPPAPHPLFTLPKLPLEPAALEVFPPPALPLRRFDQDALQALFMTEETLDLPRISTLAASLPGVYACVIATRDQACTGGTLPEGFDLAALLGLAPRVGEAAGRMPIGQLKHFTLYGDAYSVSFFERNGLSVCAVHRPRSFVPGVREKLVALADELSR